MVDTWSISDDQRWSRICFCFCNSFYSLVEVCTHGDLCYIYIAIGHSDRCHIFLLSLFTTCCELCDCTCRCGFGRLSTCVGVNFCIEYHDVDVFTTCQYVVYATETDIVSPSVTTEDPLGFLSQEVFVLNDFFAGIAFASFQSSNQFICCSTVGSTYTEGIDPFFTSCFYFIRSFFTFHNSFYFCFQTVTDCFLS